MKHLASFICIIGLLHHQGQSAVSQTRDLELTPWDIPEPSEFERTFLTSYNSDTDPSSNIFPRSLWNSTSSEEEDKEILQISQNYPNWNPNQGRNEFGTIASDQNFEFGTLLGDIRETSVRKKPGFQKWLGEIGRGKYTVREFPAKRKRTGTHGHHHWTCETEYGWRNLGRNHYPQFVRTANCTSTSCFNGLFQCVPREYTIKVLKKLERDEAVNQSAAAQLPETLRNSVKFINVTINTCCECVLV